MKRKIIALTMAAAMLLTACSGKSAGEDPSAVYYEITGVDSEETVLVLDGNDIPAELYCYLLLGGVQLQCPGISAQDVPRLLRYV